MLIKPVPLTPEAFAPFGDVVSTAGDGAEINDGTCVRYDDLSRVETDAAGFASLSVFRASPRELPLRMRMLERHPLGSQAFIPLSRRPFIVAVAPGGSRPELEGVRAFQTAPGEGVNFRRNIWHHPLIALGEVCDFLVADRVGPGDNCEVFDFPDEAELILSP